MYVSWSLAEYGDPIHLQYYSCCLACSLYEECGIATKEENEGTEFLFQQILSFFIKKKVGKFFFFYCEFDIFG